MGAKVLFLATVDYHFKAFHLPYLQWFKNQGFDVHVAAKGELKLPFVDQKYNLPIERSPFSKKNTEAYTMLKKIIDREHYDIIHCHTPVGGLLGRLAARSARAAGTKVIYTAHGFHFCKGSPYLNWMIYYPIEKWLSKWTDCLITINEEDYQLSLNHFRNTNVKHVHGVGVDTGRFRPLEKTEKNHLKKSLGYQPNDFLLMYAAEFNQNKNQPFLLRAFAQLSKDIPEMKLLLAGEGPMLEECKNMAAELGIENRVDFLGFQNGIEKWIQISDVAVASSKREGLPVNIMESMACALPVVAVDNRGHRELIKPYKNGWLIESEDDEALISRIKWLFHQGDIRQELGQNGRQLIVSTYSTQKVLAEKSNIYQTYINPEEGAAWMVQ
ncbi:glycosyltransferase family 4 protein [Jeotgalibacillus proteolyticus]|uniref:Glycosyltransferase family 1 protein n=1 Tax=Jeotgalibacillus proteolyticus TaxID=2082395 RepID=A0A2S5G8C3_9BACL|nr:glycosyltransferase family 4 protein [Jeotgalibacillus proteolyticus]PPA69242.1 glycosyltransferase family 1 protein [Jeotgalibacillus proteolyticus]